MNFKVKTNELQKAVNLASKGVGGNRLAPLTELVELSCVGGKLYIKTTDTNNTLTTWLSVETEEKEDCTAFCVVADTLFKLIGKQTCEYLTFRVAYSLNNSLTMTTDNGKYSFDVVADEEGDVTFPPVNKNGYKKEYEVAPATFANILQTNVGSLDKDNPVLKQYCIYDGTCYSTNTAMVTFNDLGIDIPNLLINKDGVAIMAAMGNDKGTLAVTDDFLMYYTDNAIVEMPINDISTYPAEKLSEYNSMLFDDSCEVDVKFLRKALSNVSLFNVVFDRNAVYLSFTKDGIVLKSKRGTAKELVFAEVDTEETVVVDAVLFDKMLSAFSDKVTISYNKNLIAVEDDNSKTILCVIVE